MILPRDPSLSLSFTGEWNENRPLFVSTQAVASPPKPTLPAASYNGNGSSNGNGNGLVPVSSQSFAPAPIPDSMAETQARLIALAESSFPINEKTPLGAARQELEKDSFGRVKALSTFQVSVHGVVIVDLVEKWLENGASSVTAEIQETAVDRSEAEGCGKCGQRVSHIQGATDLALNLDLRADHSVHSRFGPSSSLSCSSVSR